MKDCEKLMVIAYLNIDDISNRRNGIFDVSKQLTDMFDDSVKTIIIPVRTSETRIEFFKADSSTSAIALDTIENLKSSLNENGFVIE